MAPEALLGAVPDGWAYTTLGAACALGGGDIQTGPFGSQLHASDYVPEGVPSIMPKNIGSNRVVEDDIARITESDAARLRKYRVREGDIVYSRRGDVERRALIRAHEDGWLCGTGCLRVRFGVGHVNTTFASYYLGDARVREWVVRHAHGATMANLNTGILSALPFALPPLAEQQAIAAILGAFDDKIELNRRMSDTLEAMARALFKSWFVDFDPVRTKMDGRSSRADRIAQLFPQRLSESEIGWVPDGWAVRPIGDLAEVVGGTTPRTNEPAYWDGGSHQFATPKDLSTLTTPVLRRTEKRITDLGLSQIGSGLLPPGTVLMSSRAPIGYLAIAEVPVAINQGFIAMKPRPGVPAQFLLRWAASAQDEVLSRANGSTFLEISKANFRPIMLAVPPEPVMLAYQDLADPLYRRVVVCEAENDALATVRDTLLPRLISGELRVPGAERIAAEVSA